MTGRIPARHKPACWTWGPPTAADLERTRRRYVRENREGNPGLPAQWEPSLQSIRWTYMADWHRDRCAICGSEVSDRMVRRDHDHDSGLFRGFLCPSCNTQEGVAGNRPLFVNYRLYHPGSSST